MRQLIIVLFSVILLAACGGGSGGGSSTTPQVPAPQPDPTLTIKQENSSCEVAKECLLLSGTVTKNATATSFNLDGIDSAVVEVAGVRTDIASDGTVSFSATASFKLYVTHSTAETLTLGVNNFTVDGKSYTVNNSSVAVEFIAPESNARLELTSLECGEGSCNGVILTDTPIEAVNFTLDDGISITLEANEESFTSQGGTISFLPTTEINVTFSNDKTSFQQASRLTTNLFNSVTVSGNLQEVAETLILSFDKNVNITVAMMIPTIYGGASVTTDPTHEKKAIKKVVQFGAGIESYRERVVLDSLTYSFLKWNMETSQFDVINTGTIEAASGLTEEEAETLEFYADTTPWLYRIELSATLSGGDLLTESKTFVKREEEASPIHMLFFPKGITSDRVDQIHTQYDALEEGVEFSSTLANLYPREYMDEHGNINPATCFYTWELEAMRTHVDTEAEVDLKTYCNVNTPFSIANIETEMSMMLSVTSQQHNDLVARDFTLPSNDIFVDYEAQKGSNIVDWKFYSFANPGTVEMSFVFPTNNTTGFDNTVVFGVAH